MLYVSNADLYKHQWKVIEAAELLMQMGKDIELTIVGGGSGLAYKKMLDQKNISDPENKFIFLKEFVPQSELPDFLSDADIFVFASSCENMPNTLLEAMAVGLPIACSNRGPMPEVLDDGGVYFNPEDSLSIANAVKILIEDSKLRSSLAVRSKVLAGKYSWERCAKETWNYLAKISKEFKGI